MSNNIDIRVAEKPILTIEEASILFCIGQNTIRRLIANNPRAKWIFRVGTWQRIKRKPFEEFIDSIDAI